MTPLSTVTITKKSDQISKCISNMNPSQYLGIIFQRGHKIVESLILVTEPTRVQFYICDMVLAQWRHDH